jgi:hypothetical protein
MPRGLSLLSTKRVLVPISAVTLAIVVLVGLRFTAFGQTPASLTLDDSIQFQTMTGWEATDQLGQELSDFGLYKDTLYDQAVNDLGINRIRLEVRSAIENPQDYWAQFRNGQIDHATWRCLRYSTVNDNSNPSAINSSGFQFSELDFKVANVVLPLKQRLEARGEKLFINLEYVAFTNQIRGSGCSASLQYIHDDPAEYAEFMLAASLHLRDTHGLVPDAWEIALEPDNVPEWNGNLIGRAIVATAARLEQNGFTPRFIAPSTTSMSAASSYFDGILQVPGAVQYISELAYHRYSGVSSGALNNIVTRANQHGIGTAMLEHIGSGYQDLHEDLKVGNNSAWQQYALAFPTSDNGAQYYRIDTSNPSSPQVVMGSRTKYLRQYFKFVRIGAQRIGAATTDGNFDPVGFINADGKYVVVVKANGGGSFTVSGLPAGTYGIKYTTSSQYDVDHPDATIGAGGLLSTSIPAQGVITVYGKSGAPSAGANIYLCISEGIASGTPTPCPPP